MAELPTGTVTFLFTDIEGSTRLLQSLGERYDQVLATHNQVMRDAIDAAGGTEVATEGDAFFAVFTSPRAALSAAVEIQRGLAAATWPDDAAPSVRMGLHTGAGHLAGDNYGGIDVHRAARISAAGHGGQVLVSGTTAALVADALIEGVALDDLGQHNLKDLEQPLRIFQVNVPGMRSEFPPINTLGAPRPNLPEQLTSFVGREEELKEVHRLLETNRLVTLTGPGGTGKTRLAIRTGNDLASRFSDGVHFVPLANLRDPDLVLGRLLQVLRVPPPVMPYPAVPSQLERLVEHVAPRHLLLILDNFEQIQAAAPMVAELLAAAPDLRLVVTSRSPLRISGEQELAIPPLGLPAADVSVEAAMEHDSVALFLERARSVRSAFSLTESNVGAVIELCSRLDGLPLAIELAAARVKLLTPEAMLARLSGVLEFGGARDRPDRQRTLRGAIAWSHDLLDDKEQLLFARLAVFRGGASLEAIETVAGGDDLDAFEELSALVDESLVRRVEGIGGEDRFAMLETIHEFAAEQLSQLDDRAVLRRRHAEYCLAVAEATLPRLFGRERRRWLDHLETEHDNLRDAFLWALDEDPALAMRLSAALWRFWQMRGHLDEGAELVATALERGDGVDPQWRVSALDALGGIEHWRGNQLASRHHYEEALAIQRHRRDDLGAAEQLYNLSFTHFMSPSAEDVPQGRALAEESLVAFQDLGDLAGEARALWAMAGAAMFRGDHTDSRTLAWQALDIERRLGDTFMVTWVLFTIGRSEYALGNFEAARAAWAESLSMLAESEDAAGTSILISSLADLAWAQGDRDRALHLTGVTGRLEKLTGAGIATRIASFNGVIDADGVLSDPDAQAALAEGRLMSIEQAVALALEESPVAS